ncbi:MAG: TonB-dependent receptor [Prevotellaceae bacterium]|nr:TonB-dependent receptor [Prevotellaceae bacterium]
MDLKFKKSVMLMGVCSVLGAALPSDAYAGAKESPVAAVQQAKKVHGTVTDDMGPVIGATVKIKGTNNGVITDFDGNYSINAKPGDVLVITFVGAKPYEVTVGNASTYNIKLESNSQELEEVVVVGYGVQKKKLVTGATVQVKGDDIAKLNTTSALQAMQSQSPGVQITQSTGQAGDGFKVNIRGIGTTGNSAPLYVIDGITGGDINSLNPSDIESIDVLKDAASAAIYGARAANGVILITTKQGKAGKLQVSYDGYAGWQYLAKEPDVLDAKEYMYAEELKAFNGGNAIKPWDSVLPANLYQSIMDGTWSGTNWLKESYHKGAPIQNHAVNLTGGNDLSKFSLGVSYTNQKGILGGEAQSNYERYNARMNSEHILLKAKDFDVIKIGENITFSHKGRNGISTGNMYWNNVHSLLMGNPLLPAYDEDGSYYCNDAMNRDGWSKGSGASNPLATAAQSSQGLNESKSWDLSMIAYLEVQPIKNLIWRSQFGYKYWNSTYRNMEQVSNNGSVPVMEEAVNQNMETGSKLSWENTIAYTLQLGKNNLNVVVGNSIEKNSYGVKMDVTSHNSLFGDDWDRAFLSNTKPADYNVGITRLTGEPLGDWSLASFFGRASWNYDEKYMAQFTIRTDGSSNFMRGHRWGTFPSASVGWVVTNEKFMQKASSWLDFLKIRASWGQNGNQSISNFQYLTSYAFDNLNGYYFGIDNKTLQTTGGYANILKNEDVTWETSEQIDLGIDARFLGGRLGFNFDWYQKKTKDWLVQAPIQAVWGLSAPYINGGDVKNTGIEIGLNWNDRVGKDFSYGAGFNLSTNKNEVTRIANSEGIIHGPASVLHQQEEEIFRAEVGKPIGYFWGMKTAGVFQNQAQIDEWLKTNKDELHGTPQPGDIIYVDTNGDGLVNKTDKVEIGNPHPDVTIGFNIHAEYKGFDIAVTGSGAFGQQIVRTWDKGESTVSNYNKKILYGSWKGEGTSNLLPKLDNMNSVNWMTFSDIWVEDADYVKIQNVTLGYDFARLWKNCPFGQLRLYVQAQNLFTFTGYSGMDPEIGSSGGNDDSYSWGSGIDNGFYPSPRTYLVGVNIKF